MPWGAGFCLWFGIQGLRKAMMFLGLVDTHLRADCCMVLETHRTVWRHTQKVLHSDSTSRCHGDDYKQYAFF